MKVLVLSHAHPDVIDGGAQLAAYRMHQEFLRQKVDSHFFSWAPPREGRHSTFSGAGEGGRDILFHPGHYDSFLLRNNNRWVVTTDYPVLLDSLKPDVVHFHHYVHVGLDLIRATRNALPNARIFVTLHEFCAICHAAGRMVKTGKTFKLCERSGPAECHSCFPEITPEQFTLRKLYIQSMFALVDGFISPSQFLKDRYVAWGLPEHKIVVLENGLPESETAQASFPARKRQPDEPVHFAFFGKVLKQKGVDVVFDALDELPEAIAERMRVTIYGSGAEEEGASYERSIRSRAAEALCPVRIHGKYAQSAVPRLMADVDYVLVPSVWWENSPIVIQEAFQYGKPVICANIGGMAEKVEDGVSGLHFEVNDALDMARVMAKAVELAEDTEWTWRIPKITRLSEMTRSVLEMYSSQTF